MSDQIDSNFRLSHIKVLADPVSYIRRCKRLLRQNSPTGLGINNMHHERMLLAMTKAEHYGFKVEHVWEPLLGFCIYEQPESFLGECQ